MSYSGTIRSIDNTLNSLQCNYDNIIGSENPIVQIISLDIKGVFEDVRFGLRELIDLVQPEILEDVLEEYRVFKKCRELIAAYKDVIQKQLHDDLFITIKKAEEQYKELLNSIVLAISQKNDLLKDCAESIEEYMNEYECLYELRGLLEYSFRRACDKYSNELDELKKRAFTHDDWINLLRTEFDAMECVTTGQTDSLLKEERFSIFRYDTRFIHEPFLVSEIRNVLKADDIYLFNTLPESVIEALNYSCLDPMGDGNIDFLFKCVLRHNIIVSEIYPEKKKEFLTWMGKKPLDNQSSEQSKGNSEEKEIEASKTKKTRGPRFQVLFMKDGNKNIEDTKILKTEAERVKRYIRNNHLGDHTLNTSKDDNLNKMISCFWWRWHKKTFVGEDIPAAAIFRFLTEQCGLKTSVTQKSYTNKIKGIILDKPFDINMDKKIGGYFI